MKSNSPWSAYCNSSDWLNSDYPYRNDAVGKIKNQKDDVELCNYISTEYVKELKAKLGDLTIFYIAYNNDWV